MPLGYAQGDIPDITKSEVEYHMRFLASDELRGRKTGEFGNLAASRFIAEWFRKHGLKTAPNLDTYYQEVPFALTNQPSTGSLVLGNWQTEIGQSLLILQGDTAFHASNFVFLNYAWTEGDDLRGVDVKGKVVLALFGSEENSNVQKAFSEISPAKRKKMRELGAHGLIEIYNGRIPWKILADYFGGASIKLSTDLPGNDPFTHALINAPDLSKSVSLVPGTNFQGKFKHDGMQVNTMFSPNVVGYLEGTDADLKDEFIALSAHYDHVGVNVQTSNPQTRSDSIFNGARDNAIGVSAVLSAAKYFAGNPVKRSMLFIAFTGEEEGLLGSKYYVDNPVIPLERTVFNLNTDGAGYTDTTIVAVAGLNRVGAGTEITEACTHVGLFVVADPAPEQNLFDRSDNVNFAKKGIPAPTISPGFRKFDQSLMEHYHQPSDEVEGLDFNYLLRFCQAFTLSAKYIGNMSKKPKWVSGDKYEAAYLSLFGK